MARRKQITSTTVIVATGIALLVGFVMGRATSPRNSGAEPVEVASASGAASKTYVEKGLDLDPSPGKGAENPTIVIHEISDFQ
ncbi:MAG: hypothetical protein ACPGU1_07580 [Myxococcota bacterium]